MFDDLQKGELMATKTEEIEEAINEKKKKEERKKDIRV